MQGHTDEGSFLLPYAPPPPLPPLFPPLLIANIFNLSKQQCANSVRHRVDGLSPPDSGGCCRQSSWRMSWM
jgi:hypothetical protein